MDCAYYASGLCRSCSWLPTPYVDQLEAKQEHARSSLAAWPGISWLPPVASAETRFRTKAKMVVSGTSQQPLLGILDPTGRGVDLRECPLHVQPLHGALPALGEFVSLARLTPYDVPGRTGELKHLIVSASPDGQLLVRFVLRSTEALARIRKHLPWLLERLPGARVVSVNVQPRHAAVLEGDQEVVLHGDSLPVRVNGLVLHLLPQSFFQTNGEVAAALYREAAAWADEVDPRTVWDLYCGVGGFALHLADAHRRVHGVELSPQAVHAARLSAAEAGLGDVTFEAADATGWLHAEREVPDLVVVNPPRRGLGPDLVRALETAAPRHLLYSSCNPVSLARDLAAMPSLEPVRARVFDMFPHTDHQEVLVLCERR